MPNFIDQRRGARPLPPCPRCGGVLRMGAFRHRKGSVEITADCFCGYEVRVLRSAMRRI